jgi:hypothetical protein
MPRGPHGEKRPADAIGCAVLVGRIATGSEEDAVTPISRRSNSGRAGAIARNEAMTSAQRKSLASNAAKARWGKV